MRIVTVKNKSDHKIVIIPQQKSSRVYYWPDALKLADEKYGKPVGDDRCRYFLNS